MVTLHVDICKTSLDLEKPEVLEYGASRLLGGDRADDSCPRIWLPVGKQLPKE